MGQGWCPRFPEALGPSACPCPLGCTASGVGRAVGGVPLCSTGRGRFHGPVCLKRPPQWRQLWSDGVWSQTGSF